MVKKTRVFGFEMLVAIPLSTTKPDDAFQRTMEITIKIIDASMVAGAWSVGVDNCEIVATVSMKPTRFASTGTSNNLRHKATPFSGASIVVLQIKNRTMPRNDRRSVKMHQGLSLTVVLSLLGLSEKAFRFGILEEPR